MEAIPITQDVCVKPREGDTRVLLDIETGNQIRWDTGSRFKSDRQCKILSVKLNGD